MHNINFQQWKLRRQEIVESVINASEFVSFDPTQLSNDGIRSEIVNIAEYFSDATVKPSATMQQAAKLFCVTEGRHANQKYTACVDLAGLILTIAGVSVRGFTNRDDDNADGNIDTDEQKNLWSVAKNVEYLVAGAKKLSQQLGTQIWIEGTERLVPASGDIVVIGGSAGGGYEHALVCTNVIETENNRVLNSIDGGQVDAGGQCVKHCARSIWDDGKRFWLKSAVVGAPAAAGHGGRGVLGHIETSTLIYAMGTRGLLVNPRRHV